MITSSVIDHRVHFLVCSVLLPLLGRLPRFDLQAMHSSLPRIMSSRFQTVLLFGKIMGTELVAQFKYICFSSVGTGLRHAIPGDPKQPPS